jgi:hypothetical protein
MDEVSFAIDENKAIVPILLQSCDRPYRLRRLQYVDFTLDHSLAFDRLCGALATTNHATPPPDAKPKLFISATFALPNFDHVRRAAASKGFTVFDGNKSPGSKSTRDGLLTTMNTCDFFLGVWSVDGALSSGKRLDVSPWLLWESGAAFALGLSMSFLISADLNQDAWKRIYPDRRVFIFHTATFEAELNAVLSYLYGLPRRGHYLNQ